MPGPRTNRRDFLRMCALMGTGALAACTAAPPTAPAVAPTIVTLSDAQAVTPTIPAPTPTRAVAPTNGAGQDRRRSVAGPIRFSDIGGREALIAQAKAEGTLVVSGVPHDWLNYDVVIDSFTALYGISVTELTPSATASDVIAQLPGVAGAPDDPVPDVVDLVASVGIRAAEQRLLQPYQHEHWQELAAEYRDTDGYWSSAYTGMIALAVNKAAVAQTPRSWQELRSPAYRGHYALTGDPRSSAAAAQAVYAGSLADARTLDDGTAAIAYYRALFELGVLQAGYATTERFMSGETPIIPVWSYTAHALRAHAGSNPLVDVVLPTPAFLGAYIHGISAYAAHPYAARLWIEHLFSDEVQMRWATAYALPSRIEALATNPTYAALLDPLGFAAPVRSSRVLPSQTMLRVATTRIGAAWDSVVAPSATP